MKTTLLNTICFHVLRIEQGEEASPAQVTAAFSYFILDSGFCTIIKVSLQNSILKKERKGKYGKKNPFAQDKQKSIRGILMLIYIPFELCLPVTKWPFLLLSQVCIHFLLQKQWHFRKATPKHVIATKS